MNNIVPQNLPTIPSAEETSDALLDPNAGAPEVAEAENAGKAKASDAYGKKGLLSADNKHVRRNTLTPAAGTLGAEDFEQILPPDCLRTTLKSGLSKIMGRAGSYFPERTQKLLNATGKLFERFNKPLINARANALENSSETFELPKSPGSNRLSQLNLGATTNTDDVDYSGGGIYSDDGDAQFVWFDTYNNSELWSDGTANIGEVLQGGIGDCYFLSALASVIATDPDRIDEMIEDNGDGTYTVTFYELEYSADGFATVKQPLVEHKYTVDSEILITADEGYIIGAGIVDADGDNLLEIGPAILEKAFAMFAEEMNALNSPVPDGSYPMFGGMPSSGSSGFDLLNEGGDPAIAAMAITGSENWTISADFGTDAELLDLLSSADEGVNMTVGTGSPTSNPLIVDGHAYTVLGVVEIDGEEYVVLRNPWGVDSDCDEFGNPQASAHGANDGIIMLTLDEFKEDFQFISFDKQAYEAKGTASNSEGYNSVAGALEHFSSVVLGESPPYVDPDVQDWMNENFDGDWDNFEYGWSNFCTNFLSSESGPVDVNALVQWVLREAYMENTKDLHFYAEKVQYFNEVKKCLREELTRARDALTANAGAEETDALVAGNFVGNDINTEAFGELSDIVGEGTGTVSTTKAELDTYIQKMEEVLNSVGDDAQLANVDLQNMLQKQQQTLQMQSNIAKMLHDTAMAVIRKIGG